MKFLVGLLTGLVIVLLIVMSIHLSEPKVQVIKAQGKINLFAPGPNNPWRTPDYLK